MGLQRVSKKWYSSGGFGSGDDDIDNDDDFIPEKPELQMQGVDPRKGWGFRGVHKVNKYDCFITSSHAYLGNPKCCLLNLVST